MRVGNQQGGDRRLRSREPHEEREEPNAHPAGGHRPYFGGAHNSGGGFAQRARSAGLQRGSKREGALPVRDGTQDMLKLEIENLDRQVESISELAEPCPLLETGDEIGSSGDPDVEELERPVRITTRESWGAFKRHVAPHLCNCVAICTLSQLASFVPIAERACAGAVVEQTKWIAEVLRRAVALHGRCEIDEDFCRHPVALYSACRCEKSLARRKRLDSTRICCV